MILPTGQGDDCVSHKKGVKGQAGQCQAKLPAATQTPALPSFCRLSLSGAGWERDLPFAVWTLDCVLPRPELAPPTSTTANFPSPRIFPSSTDQDPREPPPTWEPHFERPSRLCVPSVGAVSWSFRLISVLPRPPRAACAHCRRAPCSALPLSSGRQSSTTSPTSLNSTLFPTSNPHSSPPQHRFALTRISCASSMMLI